MSQNFGAEVSNVQPEDAAFSHGAISPRRRPHPTVATDFDAADWCQPAPEVRILAVKFNRPVEAANSSERATPDSEIAAVENRAKPEHVVNGELRRCRQYDVIGTGEETTAPVPVVKAIRTGNRHARTTLKKSLLEPLEPEDRSAAVSVHVGQNVALCVRTGRLACNDKALDRLVDHPDTGHRASHRSCLIGAGVVDNENFVSGSRLSEERKQTGGKVTGLVISAHNGGDSHDPGSCLDPPCDVLDRIDCRVVGCCNNDAPFPAQPCELMPGRESPRTWEFGAE